jgi:hypothetical protein
VPLTQLCPYSVSVSFGSAGTDTTITFKLLLWIFVCNLIDVSPFWGLIFFLTGLQVGE